MSQSPPPALGASDLDRARHRVARLSEEEVRAAFQWHALPSRHGAVVAYLVRAYDHVRWWGSWWGGGEGLCVGGGVAGDVVTWWW